MVERGKLIVLDGSDGSGKRTQAELLAEYLRSKGKPVLLKSFPDYEGGFFGQLLGKALRGEYGDFVNLDPHIVSPLYAADRWRAKDGILNILDRGGYVVCDRWVSSNQIHQGGKISEEGSRREFLRWLDKLEYGEFLLPRADIQIFLDVPVHTSLGLIKEKSKDTAENNLRYLENSLATARWLVSLDPDSWAWVKCTVLSGAMLPPRVIHEEILNVLGLELRTF